MEPYRTPEKVTPPIEWELVMVGELNARHLGKRFLCGFEEASISGKITGVSHRKSATHIELEPWLTPIALMNATEVQVEI